MPDKTQSHPDMVDDWLKVVVAGLAPEEVFEVLKLAIAELWQCAQGPLSVVTLKAIFDRVLYNVAERYPTMSSIKTSDLGVQFDDFTPNLRKDKAQEITEAFRFMIVEFLAITGSLTDQVITPALHAGLTEVTAKKKVAK